MTSLQDVKTSVPDQLLEFLNNYYPSNILTYEINPEKFLDTKICYNNGSIATKVHRWVTKLAPHWSLSIPKIYKWNGDHRDLCRVERISSDFNNEMMLIRQKIDKCNPSPFTNSVIRDYEHKQNKIQQQEGEYIRPPNFFEIAKRINVDGVSILPTEWVCSQTILVKVSSIKSFKKKVKNLFSLKDKNPYPAYQIYKGTWDCDETYCFDETYWGIIFYWKLLQILQTKTYVSC